MSPIVFEEREHPRDGLGRFRKKLNLRGALGGGIKEVGDAGYASLDEDFGEWHDSLTDEEATSLGDIIGTSNGAAINGVMRHGTLPEGFVATDAARQDVSDKTLKAQARAIDSALNKASLPEGVMVYREFKDEELAQVAADGNLVGARVSDDGFMSTSTIPSWDMEDSPLFMSDAEDGSEGAKNPTEITDPKAIRTFARIRVPEGAHAAPVDRYSAAGFSERELLLQDGTTAEVTKAVLLEDAPGGPVLMVTMDVVEQLGGSGDNEKDNGEVFGEVSPEGGQPESGVDSEAIDPKGDAVVYEPRMGAIFVEQPPTPTPSDADVEALREAYPDAKFILWGEEDVDLEAQAAPEPESARDAPEAGEGLEAAEERLRSLGIPDVSVGSDAASATMVADGLERVADKGVAMPDELVVDSAPFDEEYGDQSHMVPARVLAGKGRVVMQVNPRAEGWRSPEVASRIAAEQRDAGFWASDDPLHPIYHEAAHGAHFKALPSEYASYEDELDPDDFIAQRLREVGAPVSRYAQRNVKEFVAEVFAGLMSGQEYPTDTMQIYENMGGPTV